MKTFYTRFIAVLALSFLISLNVKAQETTLAPSHLKATEDMLISMNMPELFAKSMSNTIKTQSTLLPLDKQKAFSEIMTAFFDKYLNWNLLKNDFTKIYASEFSESEIKELTKFYSTPLGKKVLEKSPALLQKGMQLGQQTAMAHQVELQDIMKFLAPKN